MHSCAAPHALNGCCTVPGDMWVSHREHDITLDASFGNGGFVIGLPTLVRKPDSHGPDLLCGPFASAIAGALPYLPRLPCPAGVLSLSVLCVARPGRGVPHTC